MGLDIHIKQTGLIKKKLPMKVVLGDKLSFGKYDRNRLEVGERTPTEYIVFDPEHIARGFSVDFPENETDYVDLRMLFPTTDEEIAQFMECVKRICSYWKCSLECDGEATTVKAFTARFDELCKFNLSVLRSMSQRVLEEDSKLTLFSAMWPLSCGEEEANRFKDAEDVCDFRDWLHEMQSMDVYFAVPNLYKTDDGILGVYCLCADTRSVFPKTPEVPFGITGNDGEPLKVDRWELYAGTLDKSLNVRVPYSKMIERLPAEKCSRYDGNCIIIEPLTLEEIKHFEDE